MSNGRRKAGLICRRLGWRAVESYEDFVLYLRRKHAATQHAFLPFMGQSRPPV